MIDISSVLPCYLGKEVLSYQLNDLEGTSSFVDLGSINSLVAEHYSGLKPIVYGIQTKIFYDSVEIFVSGFELVKPKFSPAQESFISDVMMLGGLIDKDSLTPNQMKSFNVLFSKFDVFSINEDNQIRFSDFFSDNFLQELSGGLFSYIDDFNS